MLEVSSFYRIREVQLSIIKTGFIYQSINIIIIINMIFTHLFVFSIIDNCPFIASDKWTQKYADYIVLCSLCTSGLYNVC